MRLGVPLFESFDSQMLGLSIFIAVDTARRIVLSGLLILIRGFSPSPMPLLQRTSLLPNRAHGV